MGCCPLALREPQHERPHPGDGFPIGVGNDGNKGNGFRLGGRNDSAKGRGGIGGSEVGDGRTMTRAQGPGGQPAPDPHFVRAGGSIPLQPVRMRETLYHSEGWERRLFAVSG